jgi:hypothetical protein
MNADDTDRQEGIVRKRAKIIDIVDPFRQRKAMSIDPVIPEEAEKFLYGFDADCLACGAQ